MRLRVVCGFGEMIASFSPTSALSRVDLPALGLPRMQTKPDRNGMRAVNAELGSCQRRCDGFSVACARIRSEKHGDAHVSWLVAHRSYQFKLPRLHRGHTYALDLAVGGLQHFEAQAVFFDRFAFARNS